jgi:hypothetical protein
LLSRVQLEQANFDAADDLAIVRAGYEPLHWLLFGAEPRQVRNSR